MKLTQELLVTIVFLGGSWVTMSVVAVAVPLPTSPATKTQTTHTSDDKHDVVQVVTGDLKQDELFILGENDVVPEKIIEENPNAKMIVAGADETSANAKIEQFNVTAKAVAMRLALQKELAAKQEAADYHELQHFRDNGSRFAIEVKTKPFAIAVNVAEVPPVLGTYAHLDLTRDGIEVYRQSVNQTLMLHEKLIALRHHAVHFASEFNSAKQIYQLVCLLAEKMQKPATSPAKNKVSVSTENKAEIRSQDLRPLNEKLTLAIKPKRFALLSVDLGRINALPSLPFQTVNAVAGSQPAKTIEPQVINIKVALDASHRMESRVPGVEVSQMMTALLNAHAAAPSQPSVSASAGQAMIIRKVVAATEAVLLQAVNQSQPARKITETLRTMQTAQASEVKRVVISQTAKVTQQVRMKQLAAVKVKHERNHVKAMVHERAISALERELSSEPVIIVPDKSEQRQAMNETVPPSKPMVNQQQARPAETMNPRNTFAIEDRQVAERSTAEVDPFEDYYEQQKKHQVQSGYASNVAAMDDAPSETEARDVATDLHNPREFSRLMEE